MSELSFAVFRFEIVVFLVDDRVERLVGNLKVEPENLAAFPTPAMFSVIKVELKSFVPKEAPTLFFNASVAVKIAGKLFAVFDNLSIFVVMLSLLVAGFDGHDVTLVPFTAARKQIEKIITFYH